MTASFPRLPPPLPAHFTEPARPWATALFLAYALGLSFGPGLLAYLLVVFSGWSLAMQVLPVAALSMVAGFGFYVMGTVAHEGFHFTLARNKRISALLGVGFSSAVFAFFGLGFYLIHSRHHRHTNQADDPDHQLFSRFTSTWQRLLVLRLVNNRGYLKLLVGLIRRGELPPGMHTVFSLKELRWLAWANVLAQFGWIAVYAGLFAIDPMLGLCVVVLPHLATAVVSAAIVFVQHGDTGDQPCNNSRSHASPWATLLMGGTNYHLEHHLYPRVACWRLPQVHRLLMASDWTRHHPPLVEPRFLAAFGLISSRRRYGMGSEARDARPDTGLSRASG